MFADGDADGELCLATADRSETLRPPSPVVVRADCACAENREPRESSLPDARTSRADGAGSAATRAPGVETSGDPCSSTLHEHACQAVSHQTLALKRNRASTSTCTYGSDIHAAQKEESGRGGDSSVRDGCAAPPVPAADRWHRRDRVERVSERRPPHQSARCRGRLQCSDDPRSLARSGSDRTAQVDTLSLRRV